MLLFGVALCELVPVAEQVLVVGSVGIRFSLFGGFKIWLGDVQVDVLFISIQRHQLVFRPSKFIPFTVGSLCNHLLSFVSSHIFLILPSSLHHNR